MIHELLIVNTLLIRVLNNATLWNGRHFDIGLFILFSGWFPQNGSVVATVGSSEDPVTTSVTTSMLDSLESFSITLLTTCKENPKKPLGWFKKLQFTF